MTIRRYILKDREILTPEAVNAILAKELLLQSGGNPEPSGRLIGARHSRTYFAFSCRCSDSAEQLHSEPKEDSALLTMFASEAVLRREWDTPEEDEAWANL
jgi:hypothetical protein